MPRIVCLGANIESQLVLQRLINVNADIVGVVTLPSRSHPTVSDYRDLHPLCDKADIPVIDTEDINSDDTIATLKRIRPECLFVLGWNQLLGSSVLSIPTECVVGSHPTPLPERRGRAPIPWTILEGHTHSAVSLFRMTKGIDDGPLLMQRWFEIPERVYAIDLYQIIAETLASCFVEVYDGLQAGTLIEQEQNKYAASYRARRGLADGHIDFLQTAEYIDRLIRAVSAPYPGAYTYYRDQKIQICRVDPYEGTEYRGVPGQILKRQMKSLIVQAGDKPIVLSDFSTDGQVCGAGTFAVGEVFGYRTEDTLADLRLRMEELEKMIGGE